MGHLESWVSLATIPESRATRAGKILITGSDCALGLPGPRAEQGETPIQRNPRALDRRSYDVSSSAVDFSALVLFGKWFTGEWDGQIEFGALASEVGWLQV
jgi:hypothetical protein